MKSSFKSQLLVWDLPLRLWHWAFVVAIGTALATALIDELQSLVVHQWAGITVFCLLVFRLTWGLWGGIYARWQHYRTTPKKFIQHFRRRGVSEPHTSPGIVLVLILMLAALAQSTSGLFMTDDVFFEAPLHDFIEGEAADVVDDIHTNAWRLLLVAVSIHLLAHFIYGLVLRNTISLSMVTGKKQASGAPTHYGSMAVFASTGLALICFGVLATLAD